MGPLPGRGLLRISRDLPRLFDRGGTEAALDRVSSSQSNQQMPYADAQNSTNETTLTEDGNKQRHIKRRMERNEVPVDCKSFKESIVYLTGDDLTCTIDDQTGVGPENPGPCLAQRCLCCNMWDTTNTVATAKYNGKNVRCKITREANCRTKNVVYALTCPECNIAYVGETKQKLGTRIAAHRRNITGKKEKTHLVEHFTQAHGRTLLPTVRILETMQMQDTDTCRKEAEAKWTLTLNTVHPWGLNTNIKGFGAVSSDTDPADRRKCPWFQAKYQRPIPKGYRQKKKRKDVSMRITSERSTERALSQYEELNWDMKAKYRRLTMLKPSELCRMVDLAHENCYGSQYRIYQELASYMLAHHSKEKPAVAKPRYIPFEYVNRFSNVLNPERIIKMGEIYPEGCQKADFPKTIFTKSFVRALGTRTLNYNRLLRKLDTKTLIDNESSKCECERTELADYVNPHLSHICTGDLGIIQDPTLRELMSKGATYDTVEELKTED